MPFELADDRDRRVRGELDLTPGIEAVDRVQQADHGHLDEVLDLLASSGELPGQVLGKRLIDPDELLARLRIRQLPEELGDAFVGSLLIAG